MEGRTINIFYDDTTGVSCKTGILQNQDDHFYTIKTQDGRIISIAVNRIIRIEVAR